MRKEILIGIGILIILLALAGTGSANPSGSMGWACAGCHPSITSGDATYYNQTHRNATMISFNATKLVQSTYCDNCHVDVSAHTIGQAQNFSLRTGIATYLNSSECGKCHQKKYDDWYDTLHRVMLTSNTSGKVMNLSVPDGKNWTTTNVSYMIVGKTSFYYLNETGRFFSKYYAANKTFAPYIGGDYNCGRCHTTGYNASGGNQSNLSGIWGTWVEEGITCENCHGPGGNGHQVTINKTGGDCNKCHYGDGRQGRALTNKHATAPAEESTRRDCTQCHSPYDRYTGAPATVETAANVTCFVCHNPHSTTDDKYGTLLSTNGFNNTSYATAADVKLSFFNGTASNVSKFNNGSTVTGTNVSLVDGNDIFDILSIPASLYGGSNVTVYGSGVKDTSYDPNPITVRNNISEVLCSKCHYRHGLAHVKGVNMTHGSNNLNDSERASCIDCHMSKVGGKADHSFDAYNVTNYPQNTCSKGTNCHVTSSENLTLSNLSIVSIETEWKASLHNEKEVGSFYINQTNFDGAGGHNNSSCSKCHSPKNWNPANESGVVAPEDFKGITCAICHNIHDMGDSINKSGLKYSWFKRNATYASGRWSSNYTLVANTTELCGNCHSSTRIGRSGPGWSDANTPIRTHGWPAKDIFVGSWKQSSLMKFECIDCHMYTNKSANGSVVTDTSKIGGHSFKVNATGLQNKSECKACHVNGTSVDEIRYVISKIQADTRAKHTTVNATVNAALANYTAFGGIKTLSADKIAQAYWNVRLVGSDESWGVHDPVGTNKLLDDAKTLAAASDASLGQVSTSSVALVTGWNLVSLNSTPSDTTPSSVMNSVSGKITVVWGYNATGATWELYDPAMPTALNTLKSMVMGKGYWIYATQNCAWTV